MRMTVLLLLIAVGVVVVLAACRARDYSAADSATDDSAHTDEPAADSGDAALDTTPPPRPVTRKPRPRASAPDVQRAGDSSRDSTSPSEDSIRAMRPTLPQVKPGTRPRTWRGFKLPEEMPVRAPLEPVRRAQQAPDSLPPTDSTKPPTPDR